MSDVASLIHHDYERPKNFNGATPGSYTAGIAPDVFSTLQPKSNNSIKPTIMTCLEHQPLEGHDQLDPQQHSQCRTMSIGQIIWVSLDRADLMFAAKLHSSRLQKPTAQDAKKCENKLLYVK